MMIVILMIILLIIWLWYGQWLDIPDTFQQIPKLSYGTSPNDTGDIGEIGEIGETSETEETGYTGDTKDRGDTECDPRIVVTYQGNQYDITAFVKYHPGGKKVLLDNNGADVETLMRANQHSDRAYAKLATYRVKNN